MPITMYRDYSYSYVPSSRSNYETAHTRVTLPEAFQMVVDGRSGAMEVFNQLSKEVQKIINDVCQDSFGKDMGCLSDEKQKDVFEMLLGALLIAKESANQKVSNNGIKTPAPKKRWWQLWR
jgi:hypothetical protein